jgi:type I restriction enzyme S subunit
VTRLRFLVAPSDRRRGPGAGSDELLSVSIHRGVVPRITETEDLARADDLANYKIVRAGDVVLNRMRAFQGAVGRSNHDGIVSPDYTVLHPAPAVDSRYLHHLFRSHWFVGEMVARLRGIGSTETGSVRTPRINWENLGDIEVSAPPLAEQRAIADYLDAETARIDALVAKKKQLIRLLDERWRVTAETTMNELGATYGWAPLKRFVECLDGRRVPLSGEERALRRGVFPYYGASGVIDRVDDYLFDETLVLLGEDGAQLADPDYEISFVVDGRVWVNNHAHVLRPVGSDPHFLALHLSTLDRGSFISGATREKITQDDMGRIPVPNCPLETQQQAAQQIRTVRAQCDATAEKLDSQVNLLGEHRRVLITAAVRGEFAVPGAM